MVDSGREEEWQGLSWRLVVVVVVVVVWDLVVGGDFSRTHHLCAKEQSAGLVVNWV